MIVICLNKNLVVNRGSKRASISSSAKVASNVVQRRRLIGTNSTNGSLDKLVASSDVQKTWHLFVGKLNKDATEEELKDYLSNSNISVIEIRKLKATQKWQENFSAFKLKYVWTSRIKIELWMLTCGL